MFRHYPGYQRRVVNELVMAGVQSLAKCLLRTESPSTLVIDTFGGARIPKHATASFVVGFTKQRTILLDHPESSLEALVVRRTAQIIRHIWQCLGTVTGLAFLRSETPRLRRPLKSARRMQRHCSYSGIRSSRG
jgi:hypothetical protein